MNKGMASDEIHDNTRKGAKRFLVAPNSPVVPDMQARVKHRLGSVIMPQKVSA